MKRVLSILVAMVFAISLAGLVPSALAKVGQQLALGVGTGSGTIGSGTQPGIMQPQVIGLEIRNL